MYLISTRYLVPRGFRGLTIWPFVISANKRDLADSVFLNHERIHLRQQAEMLVFPFLVWYVIEFSVRMFQYRDRQLAYRNISFEREAYENEKDPGYLKSRSFWKFLKFV